MGCEEYKTDDDLDEQHICPAHQKPCEHREEENYFFRLTAYQQQLLVRAYVVQPAAGAVLKACSQQLQVHALAASQLQVIHMSASMERLGTMTGQSWSPCTCFAPVAGHSQPCLCCFPAWGT